MIKWEPDLVLGSSWGMCHDWCKKPGIMPGSFNLPSLPFCPPEQACECTFPMTESPGFAYPFCQFHWSSKQLRGLLFPEPDSRAGAASVCLYLLTAWGGLRLFLASGITAYVRQAETCLPCRAPLLLLLDLHCHVTTSGNLLDNETWSPVSPFPLPPLSPFPPFPPPPLFFLDFLLLSFQSSLCILDTSSLLDM